MNVHPTNDKTQQGRKTVTLLVFCLIELEELGSSLTNLSTQGGSLKNYKVVLNP